MGLVWNQRGDVFGHTFSKPAHTVIHQMMNQCPPHHVKCEGTGRGNHLLLEPFHPHRVVKLCLSCASFFCNVNPAVS
jgi:hypothetical protein